MVIGYNVGSDRITTSPNASYKVKKNMITSISEQKMIIEGLIGPEKVELPEPVSPDRVAVAKADDDAAIFIRSFPTAETNPGTYSRPAGKAVPQVPDVPEPPRIAFEPGSDMKGTWSQDGHLMVGDQQVGTFRPVNGTGALEFEMGNIRGFTTSPTGGVAFNRDTGESFSFKLNLVGNEFSIEDIKKNEPPKVAEDESKASWKGEIKDGKVDLGGGFKITINPDGTVDAVFPQPHELSSDSTGKGNSHDGVSYGRGFLDNLGNLFLAFDNGGMVRMTTQQNNSIFQILGYENLS